jgi:hypothetical protein
MSISPERRLTLHLKAMRKQREAVKLPRYRKELKYGSDTARACIDELSAASPAVAIRGGALIDARWAFLVTG